MLANVSGVYRSPGKEKESRCLGFSPSTKREIGHFDVVVLVVTGKEVSRKCDVHAKLLLNLLLF